MIACGNNINENKLIIDNEYLNSVLDEINMPGIRIFHVNHEIRRDRIFHSYVGYPPIQLLFSLKGNNIARSYRSGEIYKLNSNRHNLLYFPHTDMDFRIEGKEAHFFGIQFSEEMFYRFISENSALLSNFWENIEKKKEAYLSFRNDFSITPSIKMAIGDITNFEGQGFIKKLFIESKIIELLVHLFEQSESKQNINQTINGTDKEKLFAVKELLEENILSEFTLAGISYKVGLNEFKLKRGFKELFGQTVFGYFNDLRMNYAKNLILNGKKKVFEVADIMGYSEPHHFTNAFKKKFGILPGALK